MSGCRTRSDFKEIIVTCITKAINARKTTTVVMRYFSLLNPIKANAPSILNAIGDNIDANFIWLSAKYSDEEYSVNFASSLDFIIPVIGETSEGEAK